jgi:hypothetical protein
MKKEKKQFAYKNVFTYVAVCHSPIANAVSISQLIQYARAYSTFHVLKLDRLRTHMLMSQGLLQSILHFTHVVTIYFPISLSHHC